MVRRMHELSIALCILDAVADEAQRRGGVRVEAVHVRIGPLSGVIKAALEPAFELAREGTDLETCRLVIEEVPIVVRCSTCQADRPVPGMQEMCCPICGGAPSEILSGREMDITAMEIYAHEYTPG
jgi:hydrogenase nickel incorporation protein HypA/HybF